MPASQPWKKQDVFVETAKWSPGKKKARKKNFPESSRPQFRNNSRYDVTPALKWKPSARSSRRRRCYYSAKVKIMPGCLRRCPLPRGRTLQSFLQAVRENTHVRRGVLQNASIRPKGREEAARGGGTRGNRLRAVRTHNLNGISQTVTREEKLDALCARLVTTERIDASA